MKDARRYGYLDNCSAFAFENYLHQIKKLVRSGKNPLAQIVKRLSEVQNSLPITDKHISKLDVKRPNNSYVLNERSCCEAVKVTNQHDEHGRTLILCRVYERVTAHSMQPCDSRIVGVYKATTRYTRMKMIPATSLTQNAIMIELEVDNVQKINFLSILHNF